MAQDKIIFKLESIEKQLNQNRKDFNQIEKRFDRYDKIFDQMNARFDKIDKKSDQHDKRFDKIDKKSDQHDKLFDRVVDKLLKHDERLDKIEETMATKDDMREIKSTLEGIATVVKHLDQDRIFTAEWVRRIENEVEEQKKVTYRHEEMLQKVKIQLNMA